MTSSLDIIYNESMVFLQDLDKLFQKLVQNSGQPTDLENKIQMTITKINENLKQMDCILYKVPASRRHISKMSVDQIRYDLRHLEMSLQMFKEKRQKKQNEISEREQLLSHRFAPNAETCVDIDYALEHNTQLGNANKGVDDMIATGGNILSSLVNQRITLEGANKRLLTIGSTLGLSNHTMKLIERRFAEDKYIMVGGMLITLIVIALVIYFMVL